MAMITNWSWFLWITVLTAAYCTFVATAAVTPVAYCCPPMYMDCDKDDSNGCETNIIADDSNCGYCGNSCYNSTAAKKAVMMWAIVYCTNGICVYVCEDGRGDCDRDMLGNGCETDLSGRDPENCGTCGVRCADLSDSPGPVAEACPSYVDSYSAGGRDLQPGKLMQFVLDVPKLVAVVSLIGCLIIFA